MGRADERTGRVLLTGKSAFCISDWQLKEAQSLVEAGDEGSRRILIRLPT